MFLIRKKDYYVCKYFSLMPMYVEKQAKQFRNIRKMFLEHAW